MFGLVAFCIFLVVCMGAAVRDVCVHMALGYCWDFREVGIFSREGSGCSRQRMYVCVEIPYKMFSYALFHSSC